MSTIEEELENSGIKVICPVNQFNVKQIASYVTQALFGKFPTLKIKSSSLYNVILKIPMYIAELPEGMSDACYFYRNSSIYFRKNLNFSSVKKLAFHECIHHLQTVKDKKGKLTRLGLCSYLGNKAYGNALNEASVQFMSSFATEEKREIVTYYGVSFPTNSPSYYPMLVNLIQQIGYLVGYSSLFDSTIYANNTFFDKFKEQFGEKAAFKLQGNFDKLLEIEETVIKLSNQIRQNDLSSSKLKKLSDKITDNKNQIKALYFSTQNLIITSYFDKEFKKITLDKLAEFKQFLYNFGFLTGTAPDYQFFTSYFMEKSQKIDEMYERSVGLTVVKKSAFSSMFKAMKKIFKLNNGEYVDNRN